MHRVKVKVKRFIGQPQGTGLTNFNTKQIQQKDKEIERKKYNAIVQTYTLEINMMANLQLYLQIHMRELYTYDIHTSLLMLYLHSMHVKYI